MRVRAHNVYAKAGLLVKQEFLYMMILSYFWI